MDDFLTRLYHEELEKTASHVNLAVFDNFSSSELENFLGLDKLAVGGPVEPEVSPAMKKSIEARETKGKDAEKRIAAGNSHSETAPDRNIAPITPGQSVPERNFVQPGRSNPENTLAVKQASVQWAEAMGRSLAGMMKSAEAPVCAPYVSEVSLEKTAAFSRSIKLASQMPPYFRQALIEKTAQEIVKIAKSSTPEAPSAYEAQERAARIRRLAKVQKREAYRKSPTIRGVRQGVIGAILGKGVGTAIANRVSSPKLKAVAHILGTTGGGTLGALRGIAKSRAARRVHKGDEDIAKAIAKSAQ